MIRELIYIWTMLKEKAENKQFDELTEGTTGVAGLYRAYLADYYLLGKKFFQAAMLSSGVGVLSFYFFSIIKSTGRNCRSVARKEYYVICYHIGFVYLTLGHFERLIII